MVYYIYSSCWFKLTRIFLFCKHNVPRSASNFRSAVPWASSLLRTPLATIPKSGYAPPRVTTSTPWSLTTSTRAFSTRIICGGWCFERVGERIGRVLLDECGSELGQEIDLSVSSDLDVAFLVLIYLPWKCVWIISHVQMFWFICSTSWPLCMNFYIILLSFFSLTRMSALHCGE